MKSTSSDCFIVQSTYSHEPQAKVLLLVFYANCVFLYALNLHFYQYRRYQSSLDRCHFLMTIIFQYVHFVHVYKSTSSFRIFLHVIFALIFFEVKRNFAASFCVELTNNIQHSWKFRVSSCTKIFPLTVRESYSGVGWKVKIMIISRPIKQRLQYQLLKADHKGNVVTSCYHASRHHQWLICMHKRSFRLRLIFQNSH